MDIFPLDIKNIIISYVPICKYCKSKRDLYEIDGIYKELQYICFKCINNNDCSVCIIF